MLKSKVNYSYWLHPLLIGLYSPVALLANNIIEIDITASFRAIVFCLIIAILLTAVNKIILKNGEKAALLSSLTLGLFYAYGHVYNTIEGKTLFGFVVGRHRYLGPLWAVLFILGVVGIIRWVKKTRDLTLSLNVIAVILILFPLYQITTYEIRESTTDIPQTEIAGQTLQLPETPPDIYYIILDGYGRQDALMEDYKYDNAAFLSFLEEQGFYVADCGRSNYSQTKFSLLTSLNMDFVEELVDVEAIVAAGRRGGFGIQIQHSITRQLLEDLGYKTVAFETGYNWTELKDADVYLSPDPVAIGSTWLPNNFETLLIQSTALSIIFKGVELLPQPLITDLDGNTRIHRDRVLFALEQLEQLPGVDGPKFVFAHIVSPHKPFVFDAEGNYVAGNVNPNAAYADQVAYLNQRVMTLVAKLIQDSATPPIIIIQGDHGGVNAGKENRLKILNVYYLPDGGADNLYPNITPINTFRVIFNTYFGAEFPLLEDSSFFSRYADSYVFEPVSEDNPACISP